MAEGHVGDGDSLVALATLQDLLDRTIGHPLAVKPPDKAIPIARGLWK